MPYSDARIAANRRNAQLSSGPRTVEGKEQSRANALKHGLTGAGVVLPQADAAEVERRAAAFAIELSAEGEVGKTLARRAALNSVRMERAADQQTAALSEKVRQVEADFVPPEGVDAAQAAKLRSEAVRIAMFDPSKEATLARRYENAAERAFFKCFKELRQRERESSTRCEAEADAHTEAMMGSLLQAARSSSDEDEQFAAIYAELNIAMPSRTAQAPQPTVTRGKGDIPITAGRPS